MRRHVTLLALLLAVSAALNVTLALRLRAARPEPAAPPACAPAPAPRERPSGFGAFFPDQHTTRTPAAPDAGGEAGGARAETDRAILCAIGRDQAQQRWEGHGDELQRYLRDRLGDPARQRQDTLAKAIEMAQQTGLTFDEGRALYDDYESARQRRVNSVRVALDREPADWSSVFDQMKGLYGDEDRLVTERFGDGRAQRLRDAQRIDRLASLSVIASLAGRPWEDALP